MEIMNPKNQTSKSRRELIKASALVAVGSTLSPYLFGTSESKGGVPLMKRNFGKLGFQVTTLGLGGQSSLQSGRLLSLPLLV